MKAKVFYVKDSAARRGHNNIRLTDVGNDYDYKGEAEFEPHPSGDMDASLEYLWRRMNVVTGDADFEYPVQWRCRSMCVGDVAIIEDKAYLVAAAGWDECPPYIVSLLMKRIPQAS